LTSSGVSVPNPFPQGNAQVSGELDSLNTRAFGTVERLDQFKVLAFPARSPKGTLRPAENFSLLAIKPEKIASHSLHVR